MKFLNHPVHMMIVHFPTALMPMDFVFSLLAYLHHSACYYIGAELILYSGVTMGWLAIATGLFDLADIMRNKPDAMKTALIHAGINMTVILGFSLLSFIHYKGNITADADLFILIAKGLLILVMFTGNFYGGKLVINSQRNKT